MVNVTISAVPLLAREMDKIINDYYRFIFGLA